MAKEEIYILDKNFNNFAVLDTFESFIWTDRYNEAGDFEITTVANEYYLNIFRQDYYVQFARSEHLMIIEQIEISSDAEDGNTLRIRGRSLESILDRRVIWGWKTFSGKFQNGIKELITENVISPSDSNRAMNNFVFLDTNDAHINELEMYTQYFGENLYESIVDACQNVNVGFKVILNSMKQLEFSLYYSVFHNCDQDENPFVIFSVDYDNLINSNYKSDMVNYKTVALIGGEGEGSEKRYTSYALPNIKNTGYDRREMYTDQQSVTSDLGEEQLDTDDYYQLLKSKGSEELAESIITEEFEGETLDTSFVYGIDYNLGDVVTLRNEYGKSSISRVVEYTFSKNETEDKSYPKFETVSDDVPMVYRNFDPTKKYYAGDKVDYDGTIYEALTDIEPGPFDEKDWEEVKEIRPRTVVELLWRNGSVIPRDSDDTINALFDHPFGDYDFITIIWNKPYLDAASRKYLGVRWNLEKYGGDALSMTYPVPWLKAILAREIAGKTIRGSYQTGENEYTPPWTNKFSFIVPRTDAGLVFRSAAQNGAVLENLSPLEVYGFGLNKKKNGTPAPVLLYGDGVNLPNGGEEGPGRAFSLIDSFNNYDFVSFGHIMNGLGQGNIDNINDRKIRFYNMPSKFMNELLTAGSTLPLNLGAERSNSTYRIVSNSGFRCEYSDNLSTGIFVAYGYKFKECIKLFGSPTTFAGINVNEIVLSEPFTNYDAIIFVTRNKNSWYDREPNTQPTSYASITFASIELEYVMNCYKSGEGLAALSGIQICWPEWSRAYLTLGLYVTDNNRFVPKSIENSSDPSDYYGTGIAEIYGIKY